MNRQKTRPASAPSATGMSCTHALTETTITAAASAAMTAQGWSGYCWRAIPRTACATTARATSLSPWITPLPERALETGGELRECEKEQRRGERAGDERRQRSDRTAGTGRAPVLVDRQAVLDAGKAPDRPLRGRAAILVIGGHVDEVLLVEASFCTAVGGQRLGHQRGNACLRALEDLLALEVAAVSNDGERLGADCLPRLLRHGGELVASINNLSLPGLYYILL